MENQVNIPKLRFPDFSGEWEYKKLGETCKMRAGKFIDASDINDIWDNSLYPCYGGNGLRGYTNTYNNDGKYSLIGRQGAHCGNVNLANGKFYATEHAVVVFLNQGFDTDYMYYLLGNLNLNQYSTGLAQPGLAVQNVEKIEACVSDSLPEQQKIASFLTAVDDKIQDLKKKKSLLVQYKKGVMQKTFSKDIRFKDDDGSEFSEWEIKKLGDLDLYISDGNYGELYPKASEMKDLGVPFIRANNIKNSYLVWNDMKYIEKDHHEILRSGHLLENDILVTTRGDIGMVAYVTKEFEGSNINAQICLLRANNNINAKFLIQFLSSEFGIKQFKSLQTGSALKQLPKGNLVKLDIPFPSFPEQSKIANFLSSIDEKIYLVQSQIEKMEVWKKGLLHKMFV